MLPENEASYEKILFYIFDLLFYVESPFFQLYHYLQHILYIIILYCPIQDNSLRTPQLKPELFSSIEKFWVLVTQPLISNISQ